MTFKVNLITVLVLAYFCIPKFDIINIPGIPTGIRIQDLLSLLLFFQSSVLSISVKLLKKRKLFYLILFLFLLNLIGSLIFGTHLYFFIGWLRIAQYFVVGVAIYVAMKHSPSVLKVLLVTQLCLAFLQYLKILPVVDPGRGVIPTSEYAGTFGTAAELAYFCVALTAILLMQSSRSLAIVSLILPLLNGVRAYSLMFPVFVFIQANTIGSKIFIFIPFIISVCGAFYFYSDVLVQFFTAMAETVSKIPPNLESLQSDEGRTSGDMALSHRIGKWAASLAMLTQTSASFFGTGIYSAGGALDGGLLRLGLEFGILGFLLICFSIARIGIDALLIFVVSNLFFDGYLSSVVMPITLTYLILMKEYRR